MMSEWSPETLQRIRQARQIKPSARLLGDLVETVLGRLAPGRHAELELLRKAWRELLPEELYRHSFLESMHRGQLRVLVDNAASFYELNLLAGQGLLEQLHEVCPRTKMSRIKFIRGSRDHINEAGG